MPPPSGEHGPLGPLTARHLTRRFLPPALFLSALIWAMFCSPAHRRPAPTSPRTLSTFGGPTMGTTYQVKLVGAPLTEAAKAALNQAISDALASVVGDMSTYEPTSELSRLNQRRETSPVKIGAPLMTVLKEALRISAASDGAFDVTVGPLVNAWGFGPDGRNTPPDAGQTAALSAYVGWQKLQLDEAAQTVAKTHPKLYVDLSAIAKGYAVDRVASAIEALDQHEYMVEVGGEIRAQGHNLGDQPWRIGIETPSAGQRGVQEIVALHNTAMATSGDYRNFYERDGVRVSHTIDPRIGGPITHRLASVTVLHPSCATADGWATALSVLGPTAGPVTAEREGLAAYFLVRGADGTFTTQSTSAYKAQQSH